VLYQLIVDYTSGIHTV